MKINIKHREVANDIWDGKLSQQEIARKHGICERTIRRWQNEEDFKSFLDRMDESYQNAARMVVIRYAQRAAKALVKLTEIVMVKTETGEVQRFKYRPETVRKAACDILILAGVMNPEGRHRLSRRK
jgi:transposase-like protein